MDKTQFVPELVRLLRDGANFLEENSLTLTPMAINDAMNLKARFDNLEDFVNTNGAEDVVMAANPGLVQLVELLEPIFNKE